MRTFHRAMWAVGVLLGMLLGLALSVAPPASAARNASGQYSLPSGNPVVSGTAITAAHMNTTLADVGAELTNSLDRNGRGAMAAPLRLTSGTAGAPGLTFASELSSGLYRAGTNDVRLQVGGAQLQRWTATGTTLPLALTVQGGAAVTTSTTDGAGLTATGNGTAAGVAATGGSTSGAGGTFAGGAPDGHGLTATAAGGGTGIVATGGSAGGPAGSFTGGGTNSNGITTTGKGVGAGLVATGGTSNSAAGVNASSGTAATATQRQAAFYAANADFVFAPGVVVPNSNLALTRTLTPKNIVGVWAKFTTGGAPAVADGFNVSGVVIVADGASYAARVDFAAPFANANFACTANAVGAAGADVVAIRAQAAGSITLALWDTTTATQRNVSTTAYTLHLHCVGAQ